ncbi:MAG: hypothetical protein ACI30W_08465, partial [Muribaculaceae bacterium]
MKAPWWFVVVLIVVSLPVLLQPTMLIDIEDGSFRIFVWLFPLYVVISAVCSYLTYTTRPYLSWILVALMVLT